VKKILFVDDEVDLFSVVQKLFPKELYRVVCAQDGSDGLFKCRNEEFDLIICDYKMPKVDGVKFFQLIRENQAAKNLPQTPFLFISAFADEIRSKYPEWERCDFLTKPFQSNELTQKALRLLGDETKAPGEKSEGKRLLGSGEVLLEEEARSGNVFYISHGIIAAYKKSVSGQEILITRFVAGELVGEISAIDGLSSAYKLVAEGPVELMSIPYDKIQSIVSAQPKWITMMLSSLSKQLRETLKQIK
jgi:CheY-like chemotaxis protein